MVRFIKIRNYFCWFINIGNYFASLLTLCTTIYTRLFTLGTMMVHFIEIVNYFCQFINIKNYYGPAH